jgi:DNA modification methylase
MIRDRIKALRRVRAGDLRPHPKNWRRHSKPQEAAIRAALEEIGYAGALLARETKSGKLELIDGHLRAGLDDDQKVPVLVLDVTRKEALKILASFDPIAAMATTDQEAFSEVVSAADFEAPALQDLTAGVSKVGNVEQDEPPAPSEITPRTKPGDLWALNGHRLLCGSCARDADVDRLLGGAEVHLVVTDPPYNIKVEPGSSAAEFPDNTHPRHKANIRWRSLDAMEADGIRKPRRKKKKKTGHEAKAAAAKGRRLVGDFISDEDFAANLIEPMFKNLARILLAGRSFYVWGANYPTTMGTVANCEMFPAMMRELDLHFAHAIIWDKGCGVISRKDFMSQYQTCFYGWRGGAGHEFFGPNNITDVWRVDRIARAKMIHLTEMPVELPARSMQYSSKVGENVVDFFGGSGSTLIAAEQLNRQSFISEIDPLYCDLIVERWERLCGGKAELMGVDDG